MGNDPNALLSNMTSSSFYKLPSKLANIFIDTESLSPYLCHLEIFLLETLYLFLTPWHVRWLAPIFIFMSWMKI